MRIMFPHGLDDGCQRTDPERWDQGIDEKR